MTKTLIYELNSRGIIEKKAEYTIEPKRALIAYIMQKQSNFNTWQYPAELQGIRESTTAKNHFYYDDIQDDVVVAAYPA